MAQEGKYKKAISKFKEIPNYQADFQIMLDIGRCYEYLGSISQAIRQYKQTIEIGKAQQQNVEIIQSKIMELERIDKRKEAEMVKPNKEEKSIYKSKTNFDDIIGLNKVKEYLDIHVIQAVLYPQVFDAYNKPRSMGLVLYGPAGTGKTAMARAIAGEATRKIKALKEKNPEKYKHLPKEFNIITATIHEIIDQYTGQSEKHLVAKFEEAKKYAPCILFFDELDGMGIKRSSLGGEGTAQVMRTLVETFLQQMDGLDSDREGIYVIGATNQPWDIDPALTRSGRFEQTLYVPPPNYTERRELFRYYLAKKPLKHISFGRLARATMGYSPADIKRICSEATNDGVKATVKEIRENPDRDELHIKPITMGKMLRILGDKDLGRDSLSNWYATVKKEQLGKSMTQEVEGQKAKKIKQSGLMSEDEKELYRDMLKDIERYNKSRDVRAIMRFIAIWVI